MNFNELINVIAETDEFLKQKAMVAVNQSLTIKNWLTGFYIFEFEQNGEDRAAYGENLLKNLSKTLKNKNLKAVSDRELRNYRKFYSFYPQIWRTLSSESEKNPIWRSLSSEFKN